MPRLRQTWPAYEVDDTRVELVYVDVAPTSVTLLVSVVTHDGTVMDLPDVGARDLLLELDEPEWLWDASDALTPPQRPPQIVCTLGEFSANESSLAEDLDMRLTLNSAVDHRGATTHIRIHVADEGSLSRGGRLTIAIPALGVHAEFELDAGPGLRVACLSDLQ